jgi:preprotein translocase subunit SecD
MLAAVIIIGLLISLLALSLSMANHTSTGGPPTNDIRILLVPADKSSHPTPAEMATTSTLLSQRFRSFGLQHAQAKGLTINGQPAIEVDLPHFGGNEQETINTLLETGILAFWDTGPQGVVPIGTTFNPQLYLQYNPGGQPSFTGRDLDPQYLAVTQDQAGRPQINCEMRDQAIHRFQTYTADRIGSYLTMTLDGKVLESAVIESAIAGPFALDSNFTQQRASALVSVLLSGPLPVALKQVA